MYVMFETDASGRNVPLFPFDFYDWLAQALTLVSGYSSGRLTQVSTGSRISIYWKISHISPNNKNTAISAKISAVVATIDGRKKK